MIQNADIENTLRPFVLPEVLPFVVALLQSQTVELTITPQRKTKFGDYLPVSRGFLKGYKHKISVNGDLNPHAFLFTFLHEWAHLKVFISSSKKLSPHGKEWKTEFSYLCKQFIGYKVFPKEIEDLLWKYLQMPHASTASDVNLLKTLNSYGKSHLYTFQLSPKEQEIMSKVEKMDFDCSDPSLVDGQMYAYFVKKQMFIKTVEELSKGDFFLFKKNIFCVQDKLRKYYLCKCVTASMMYKFHPLAEVLLVKIDNNKMRILN